MLLRSHFRALVAIGLALAAAACATGPAFVAAEPPAAGEAVVYLYRMAALGGAAIKYPVTFNGAPSGVLLNGSYLRYTTRAGDQSISMRLERCAPLVQGLRVRAGEIAYVEARLISGTVELGGRYYFDYRCELVRRTEAEALPALTALRRAE
jgi:hypothetical protein